MRNAGTPSVNPAVLFVPAMTEPALVVVANPVPPIFPEAWVCTLWLNAESVTDWPTWESVRLLPPKSAIVPVLMSARVPEVLPPKVAAIPDPAAPPGPVGPVGPVGPAVKFDTAS